MRTGTIAVTVAFLAGALPAFAPAARAADTVSVGSVDSTSANLWPLHIALKNGYFDAAGIKIDLVFAQSNASVIQQLAAGSYNVAPSAGIVDPIRAIDKGAPVASYASSSRRRPMRFSPSPRSRRSKTSRARPSSSAGPPTSRGCSTTA